jgi:signal transduction histidine kinase
VQLQLDVVSELPTITVDEERMVQVLGNLVSNALRYTPKNGRISLIGKMEGKRVRLGVQDNGAGISATDLPHIFDRFYRADPAREAESSGLGLAIAKALVEAHGGTLSAESELGAGTVFWVDLGA